MADVVSQCRRTWRRLGVPRDVADEMAADLEADLAAAQAEGFAPSAVIGLDVNAFATAWATERGVVHARPRLLLTVAAALVGAIPGAGFALFIAYGLSSEAMADILGGDLVRVGENAYERQLEPPAWLLLLLYGVGAAFAYAGAVAAVAAALQLRVDPLVGRTIRWLAAALPGVTAAAIGATIAFASTRDFSTELRVVVGDVVVACAVFALGVAAARVAAIRSA